MAPPDFLPLAPSGRCPRVPRCSPERDGTAAAEAATVRKTVHSRAPDTAGTPANGHCRSASGTPTRGFTHRPGESPEHAEDPRAIPRGRHVATRRDDTGPLLRRQNRHHWEPSGGRPILSAIAVDRCHRPTPPTHATGCDDAHIDFQVDVARVETVARVKTVARFETGVGVASRDAILRSRFTQKHPGSKHARNPAPGPFSFRGSRSGDPARPAFLPVMGRLFAVAEAKQSTSPLARDFGSIRTPRQDVKRGDFVSSSLPDQASTKGK